MKRFEHVRRWEEDGYCLDLFEMPGVVQDAPQFPLAYRFTHLGRVIFRGTDFGCSPLHAVDSDECVSSLLGFLSLEPGDTDEEYFADYTPRQMDFAEAHAGDLKVLVAMMEERV